MLRAIEPETGYQVEQAEEWEEVKLVVDSGATATVVPEVDNEAVVEPE